MRAKQWCSANDRHRVHNSSNLFYLECVVRHRVCCCCCQSHHVIIIIISTHISLWCWQRRNFLFHLKRFAVPLLSYTHTHTHAQSDFFFLSFHLVQLKTTTTENRSSSTSHRFEEFTCSFFFAFISTLPTNSSNSELFVFRFFFFCFVLQMLLQPKPSRGKFQLKLTPLMLSSLMTLVRHQRRNPNWRRQQKRTDLPPLRLKQLPKMYYIKYIYFFF